MSCDPALMSITRVITHAEHIPTLFKKKIPPLPRGDSRAVNPLKLQQFQRSTFHKAPVRSPSALRDWLVFFLLGSITGVRTRFVSAAQTTSTWTNKALSGLRNTRGIITGVGV